MSLDVLIDAFLQARDAGERALWECADLAAAIRDQHGPHGLHALADRSGYSYDTLRRMAVTARRFPPARRVFGVSFHHHRDAGERAPRLFPAGTPEADPVYWLQAARQHGWTRPHMVREMTLRIAPATTPENRQAQAVRRFAVADQEYERLAREVDAFNTVHAPIWGGRLRLVIEPVTLATPTPTPVSVP